VKQIGYPTLDFDGKNTKLLIGLKPEESSKTVIPLTEITLVPKKSNKDPNPFAKE
jgi:hypothetical protein